ncbi:MAG: arginine--tRNA ligase [Candidatus Omnitrophota bacterium]
MIQKIKEGIVKVVKDVLSGYKPAIEEFPVYLEVPSDEKFGDFSLNIAMKLAKPLRKSPLAIAKDLAEKIRVGLDKENILDKIERIDIKAPGFINFFLKNEVYHQLLSQIKIEGVNFGRSNSGTAQKVLIEFVSANPTGPLSIAHARQAAVGDSLAKILGFCGFEVQKEYYVNDEGTQINLLGESLKVRYEELISKTKLQIPENGYKGTYLKKMAERLQNSGVPKNAPSSFFSGFAVSEILKEIKKSLEDFNVEFDTWHYQSSLADKIPQVLEELKNNGFIEKKDAAIWLKSCSANLGDDKDRVLIKSDGTYTYLAPDIAYHKNKFERGFSRLINIWGPDHHGYINRLKAAVMALGYREDALSIIIIQLASLFRDGKPVVMSTREGEYITLDELVNEVGKDASRFLFLMRKCDSHLEFDLELAKKETLENPVYYVMYAYARILSIQKMKDAKGKTLDISTADCTFLKEKEELDLLKKLSHFPQIIQDCAQDLDSHGMTTYLRQLAGCFHLFYDKHRVMSSDNKPEVSSARLFLIQGVRQVIETGLKLLGVSSSKERM